MPEEQNTIKAAGMLQVKKDRPRIRETTLNPDFAIYQLTELYKFPGRLQTLSRQVWVQILGPLLRCSFSVPQFLHLQNGHHNSSYSVGGKKEKSNFVHQAQHGAYPQ